MRTYFDLILHFQVSQQWQKQMKAKADERKAGGDVQWDGNAAWAAMLQNKWKVSQSVPQSTRHAFTGTFTVEFIDAHSQVKCIAKFTAKFTSAVSHSRV